ncbi:GxxExxY protein [Candidatus Sumerlaeota bacterium]|nr:GxxExxY protein [Candidatus Sumerlaeota bacterium]
MELNQITDVIIGSAIEVHRTLGGPGLLESVYEECLVMELHERGMKVVRQLELPVIYKNKSTQSKYRIDLLVEDRVIVECKATSEFNNIFKAQLLTYLRLSKLQLGLILNFGEKALKDGIYRVVNQLQE